MPVCLARPEPSLWTSRSRFNGSLLKRVQSELDHAISTLIIEGRQWATKISDTCRLPARQGTLLSRLNRQGMDGPTTRLCLIIPAKQEGSSWGRRSHRTRILMTDMPVNTRDIHQPGDRKGCDFEIQRMLSA